jgi:hypothetical protein
VDHATRKSQKVDFWCREALLKDENMMLLKGEARD